MTLEELGRRLDECKKTREEYLANEIAKFDSIMGMIFDEEIEEIKKGKNTRILSFSLNPCPSPELISHINNCGFKSGKIPNKFYIKY